MAQTKRKRHTKHRGNAVGMIEVRGRTGRAPTSAEKGKGPSKKEERLSKLDRPPTWRGAFIKAMLAAVLLLFVSILLLGTKSNVAIAIFPLILVAYTLMTYYTDRYLFRRRQRRKLSGAAR